MIRMRIQLGLFDPDNKGVITESQLEDFLENFSQSIPSLENMPVSLASFMLSHPLLDHTM